MSKERVLRRKKAHLKDCQRCNVKITPNNWSRHLRSLKHLKNDPDQTIHPGRPKTKPDSDPTIPKVDRRRRDVTRKDLLSQIRRYNIKGCTKLTKQQLLPILTKVKKLLYKKDDLQQLTNDQMINIAKENNIKVNLKKRKD
jgi:hypothetical protein